jgi:cyanate permease
MSATLYSPLATVSPLLVGLAVDWQHGYFVPLLALAATSLLASGFFLFSTRPKDPLR